MDDALLSTSEAATWLGIRAEPVRQLIGRDLVIKESDLALAADRKWGRPFKKQASDGEVSTATDAPDDAMPPMVTGKPAKKARKKGGQ
jgi:hypothetical protein